MLSAKVYLIIVTSISVVNGRTVDRVSVERPTSHQSSSECYQSIRSEKKRYSKNRTKHRKNDDYAYTYKTISCKSKTVKLDDNKIIDKLFSLKL